MFTIIGADGKEYGPATSEHVRAWIAGGRANLRTQAKAAGSTEWRKLGDFPEFGGPGELPPMLPTQAGARAAAAATSSIDAGARTGAALINAALYLVCMMPGSLMMTRQLVAQNPDLARGGFPRMDDIDLSGFREEIIWVQAGLLLAILIQCILIGLRGQNIGKMLVGLRVARLDDQPAGFFRGALLRFIVPVMVMMFLNVLFPLGFLFLAIDYGFMFRADRRCLHDHLAGTKVVRA